MSVFRLAYLIVKGYDWLFGWVGTGGRGGGKNVAWLNYSCHQNPAGRNINPAEDWLRNREHGQLTSTLVNGSKEKIKTKLSVRN